jgi:hypothetical protein
MSSHYYLYCEQTGECIEALAHGGSKTFPRIEANAMGAFLLYQHKVSPGAGLRIVNVDSFGDDRSLMGSLAEVEDEFASVGDFSGYQSPILVWSDKNYRELVGRRPDVLAVLAEFELTAGTWARSPVP